MASFSVLAVVETLALNGLDHRLSYLPTERTVVTKTLHSLAVFSSAHLFDFGLSRLRIHVGDRFQYRELGGYV